MHPPIKFLHLIFTVLLLGLVQPGHGQPGPHYVLAESGLNLRASADPGSKRLTTLPYATQVILLEDPPGKELTIENLKGAMVKVDADGQYGYVFSGYLSQYPAPFEDMSLEKYIELARGADQNVYYESHYYDYGGYFRDDEGVTLPQSSWQEAFVLARQLGDIPKGLKFPPAQPGETQYENPDKPEMAWTDELRAVRDARGKLQKLVYSFRTEGSGRSVAITPGENPGSFLLMIGAIAD
ncbi:MAG: SH3 domain-containing protein [Bacteroidota bacterium]